MVSNSLKLIIRNIMRVHEGTKTGIFLFCSCFTGQPPKFESNEKFPNLLAELFPSTLAILSSVYTLLEDCYIYSEMKTL